MSERRFHLAGIDVLVRAPGDEDLSHMAGFYDRCPPTDSPPAVVLDIDRRAMFHRGRARGPHYPAFEERRVGPGRMEFSRFDAEGTVTLEEQAVRGEFVVGDSPNSLEAAIRIAVSTALPLHDALIFHASGVAGADGQAQLFLGLSGAGKSTISTMLESVGAQKVSDELVVAARTNAGWFAEVTPFIGSVGLPHGRRFPLSALNLLVQAPDHRRTSVTRAVALPQLMRHTVTFAHEVSIKAAVLDLIIALLAEVPCYELEFAKRPDVANAILLTC